MSDEIYAGKIKSITGKIQVTANHGTNTEKRAARMEDLTALSNEVVHKTITEDDKTESVTINGTLNTTNLNTTTLETTDQIKASHIEATSISIPNAEGETAINEDGFETNGTLTVAGDATIGSDLFVGGKLTVKGKDVSGTTDQSLAIVAPTVEVAVKKDEAEPISVIVAKVTDEGTQTEIKADTVKTAANKEVEISAAEVITEASSKSTIIAPEIWLKDSNSDSPVNYIKVEDSNDKVVLNAPNINLFANSSNTYLKVVNSTNSSSDIELGATNISLNGTATTTTELDYDTDEFKSVKSHTGDDIIADPTETTRDCIVNNTALRSYNKAVDAKITTTKNDLKGLIAGNTTNITKINSALGTYGNLDSGNSHTVWGEIKAIQDNISNGLHFRGVFTDKKNVDNPKSGDLIIIGTQEYVYNGTTWQELGDEDTHATYSYVDTKLADKVDNTTYNDEVKALEAEDKKIRGEFADADTALENKLTPLINAKAAQSDFDTLSAKVTEHATTKLDKSDFTDHVNAYTTHIANQAVVDAEQNNRIKAVEDSLKAEGDTYKAIAAAQAQADKGVEDAKSAQDDIDALAEKVGEVTSDKSLVDQLTAVSGRVTTLENKLPGQYKLDTGLFGELETDTEGNLTGALIIRTVQKQAAAVNGINNNEVY